RRPRRCCSRPQHPAPKDPRMEDTRRSPRPAPTLSRTGRCCEHPLNLGNTSLSVTPNGSPRTERCPRSDPEATASITPRPSRSSASTRPNWSATGDHGVDSTTSNQFTLEWVDWFNHRRLFHELGRIPPTEYEKHHYPQTEPDRQVDTHTIEPA